MLKIENTEVMGWEHAIRGMRNPKNSWEKSDSNWRYVAPAQRENHILASYSDDSEFWIGPNDADLMNRLRNAGTDHRILDDISKRKKWIDGITLSGGEPFCQIYQCVLIAEKAHEMGLSVWCYTGYLFEDLYRQGIELLKHIDVLVDGPFVQAEKSLELGFRGSRNQRVIDIPESLKEGVAILKQT